MPLQNTIAKTSVNASTIAVVQPRVVEKLNVEASLIKNPRNDFESTAMVMPIAHTETEFVGNECQNMKEHEKYPVDPVGKQS